MHSVNSKPNVGHFKKHFPNVGGLKPNVQVLYSLR
jgi:hypothetical protein